MALIGADGNLRIDLGAGYEYIANVTQYTLSLKSESLKTTKQGDRHDSYRGDGIISGSGTIRYLAEFQSKDDAIIAKQMLGFSFSSGTRKTAQCRFIIVAGQDNEPLTYVDSAILLDQADIDVGPTQLIACISQFKCTGPLRYVSKIPGQLSEDYDFCIAIVEESFATPAQLTQQWEVFRSRWPDRRFALLILSSEGELLPVTVTGGELSTSDILIPISIDEPWDGSISGITVGSDLAGVVGLNSNARVWVDGSIDIEIIYDALAVLMRKASLRGYGFTMDYYIADNYIDPFLS